MRIMDMPSNVQKAVLEAVDQNGNNKIDIEDIIVLAMKVPGVKINRADFLRKELATKCPEEMIEDAINNTPMHAGIDQKIIDKVADAVIQNERICVSGISLALGLPGGVAMAATIPADIAQYYGYLLRAMQKLMYLYGFPQINIVTDENGHILDSETINTLTLCLGIMYGSAVANNAIKALACGLAVGGEKKLLKAALTKGTIYPIVKQVATWFGKKINKQIFAGAFRKAIPILGGALSGVVTYLSFDLCCDKLKASLSDTMLSNPNYMETEEIKDFVIDGAEVEIQDAVDYDMDCPQDKKVDERLDEGDTYS